MMGWIVDSEGACWDQSSDRLARHLGALFPASAPPRQALAGFCVRNLGYVHIEQTNHGHKVALRPKIVSDIALAQAIYRLGANSATRILINYFSDNNWQTRIEGRLDAAVARLVDLVNEAQSSSANVLSQELRREDSHHVAALADLLRVCQEAGNTLSLNSVQDLLRTRLADLYVLVRPDTSGHRRHPVMRIERLGSGYGRFSESWIPIAEGARISDHTDAAYGQWVESKYLSVWESQRPVAENIDAILRFPKQEGARRTYSRIILPVRDDTGSSLLLGATLINPNIDLRHAA